jgi:hypothetical protein
MCVCCRRRLNVVTFNDMIVITPNGTLNNNIGDVMFSVLGSCSEDRGF